jgi:hypothetical protein
LMQINHHPTCEPRNLQSLCRTRHTTEHKARRKYSANADGARACRSKPSVVQSLM